MESNETASFLLDWAKNISYVISGVGTVVWPFYLWMKNKTDKEFEAANKKADKEYEAQKDKAQKDFDLRVLENNRQEKRDKEVIERIVQDAFDRNLSELKQTYIETVSLIRRGELK